MNPIAQTKEGVIIFHDEKTGLIGSYLTLMDYRRQAND